jgi:hypothetical protein
VRDALRIPAETLTIDRRSMLKGSFVGGAALAGSLFSLLPDPALAATQNPAAPAAVAPSDAKPLGEIVPVKLEYVFQIRIDFSERVSFATPNGRRAYVPAVSGVVQGPRLQGKVVPHSGADYAGNGRLNAHYMLQASDGAYIYINNTGYLYPIDGQPLDRNDPSWGGDREFYFRITPVFDRHRQTPRKSGLHNFYLLRGFVGRPRSLNSSQALVNLF